MRIFSKMGALSLLLSLQLGVSIAHAQAKPAPAKPAPAKPAAAPAAAAPVAPAPAAAPTAPSGPSPDALEKAKELKKRGDEAMDTGRPADALASYSEAYAISNDPALVYNRARSLQALTDYPRALEELEKFDREAPNELKNRVPRLQELIYEVRQKVTTVSFNCPIPGVEVRVRERVLGKCPLQQGSVKVNAGPASIEGTLEGYFPFRRDLELPGGGLATIDLQLASKATSGVLVIKSPTVGTKVIVDEKETGAVPFELAVAAGSHQVSLSKDGFLPNKTMTIVGAGERKELNIELEKETPIYGKWWFWTGVGVVIAGGVATVVALNTEKDPQRGTIDPGVVPAGFRFHGF